MSTADNDRINRIGWGLGAFAALFGIIVLVSAPWSIAAFLPAVGNAFAFDPKFLTAGGLLVAGMWMLNAWLFLVVFREGHWRTVTRHLDLALGLFWMLVMLWLVVGPPIYVSATTDEAAKFWLAVVLIICAFSVIPKFRRALRE